MFDNWGHRRYRNKETGETVIHYSTSHGNEGKYYQVIDCSDQKQFRILEDDFRRTYEVIQYPSEPKDDAILYHIKEYFPGVYTSAMRFLDPSYFEVGVAVYLTRPFFEREIGYGSYGPEHPFIVSRIRDFPCGDWDDMNLVSEVEIVIKGQTIKEYHNPYAVFQCSKINRHSGDAFEMLRRYDKDY